MYQINLNGNIKLKKLYKSTKTFGHDLGLSCAFRQWRAESHCRFIHGYALSIHLEFTSSALDDRNWVVDFGGFGDIKEWIKETFDHTTIVAKDDPEVETFEKLCDAGLIDLIKIDNVGCEAFADYIYKTVSGWLRRKCENADVLEGVQLTKVEVREHGANSAIVEVAYNEETR